MGDFEKPTKIVSAAQGGQVAIRWQLWASDGDMYLSELAEWQAYFENMTEQFPELKDEFIENGII